MRYRRVSDELETRSSISHRRSLPPRIHLHSSPVTLCSIGYRLLAISPGPSFFRRNTNLPRPGGHKGVGRNAAHQKAVCSNRRPGSDHRFPAKNGGIRVDGHPVFDVRMAFTTFLNFPLLVFLKAAGP